MRIVEKLMDRSPHGCSAEVDGDMIREFDIECIVIGLENVREHAVSAGMEFHFISEIDHLIATAKANMDDTSDTISATVADAHQDRAVIGFTERAPGAGLIGKMEAAK